MAKLIRLLSVLAAFALFASPLAAQSGGVISGRVTANGGQPLVGASITIGGTALRTVTGQGGEFRVTNVPAGTHDVTATILGYAPRTQRVSVAAGQTATASFALESSALEIGGLVVTATGREQRRREIGSSVSAINTAEVELAPVTNMSDLIQGRAAGVTVLQSSGTSGTGSRIRIRGNNSISLSNAPLLIIDGVRVESSEASLGFGVGGQQPSRINDLNPEDIENIEILKGPAASALYGTAAANGVIQVTTKRGRAGTPQVRVWSEYGQIERSTRFPDNVTVLGSDGFQCPLVYQSSGFCKASTEVYRFNPLENATTTPFEDGNRRVVGTSLSGGGESATFYVSGEFQEENGVYQKNDGLERINLQANLTGAVGSELNLQASMGFTESDLALPLGDNALFGIVPMGTFGDADPTSVETLQGYESDPRYFSDWITGQDQSRFTGSLRADYRPIPWLTFNGTAGVDRSAREEVNRLPRGTIYSGFGSVYTFGFIQNYGYDITNFTSNGSGTALFSLTEDLVSTTSIGTQFLREDFHRVYAFGAGLVPGADASLAGATSDFSAGEENIINATLSAYGQQQFAWRDRVFVNAAVRGDQNSAFGSDIGWIWYPSLSGSWVVSEEPFFPSTNFLSNLRLRAAWGQSGLRPSTNDPLFFFNPQVVTIGTLDVPSFAISEVGNRNLRPERSTEVEFGFESGFLDNRAGLQMTYFRKQSEGSLVNVPLSPSVGSSANRFENLGEVRNSGLEVMLNAQPVRGANFEMDLSLSGSFIQNELVDLGQNVAGDIPPIVLGAQQHREGYPLGGWWQRPIESTTDKNGDGLLAFGEVTVGDSVQFFGTPFPKRELSLNGNVRWGAVRISTLFDHKGGHRLLNYTRAYREVFELNDERSYQATMEEQAAQIALAQRNTFAGYIEDADFVKWRELSFTVGVPRTLTERFGARGLSLTLAGRNLKTWTDYSGLDPEVNWAGQANFTSGDFATLPPNRYYTIRVDANF